MGFMTARHSVTPLKHLGIEHGKPSRRGGDVNRFLSLLVSCLINNLTLCLQNGWFRSSPVVIFYDFYLIINS